MLLSTPILFKYNNPIFFIITITMGKYFSIRKAFYFILEKIGYHTTSSHFSSYFLKDFNTLLEYFFCILLGILPFLSLYIFSYQILPYFLFSFFFILRQCLASIDSHFLHFFFVLFITPSTFFQGFFPVFFFSR